MENRTCVKNNAHKARKSCRIASPSKKTPARKADLVSERKYSIRKAAGQHLDLWMRKTLETAWNAYIRRGLRISIGTFAKLHHIPKETWRRELNRGATGVMVGHGRKWHYPEYSAEMAQSKIDAGKRDMGPRMRMTVQMANRIRVKICGERKSPYVARQEILHETPDAYVPCERSIYNHIDAGDIGVARGDTPYHPGRKHRPKKKAHPAKVLPNRRRISERPKEADDPKSTGHVEFDTIVSCAGGKGGLLVSIDKCSLKVAIEPIQSVSQRDVSRAFKRMKRRDAIDADLKTATTDNGCEVSHQEKLERILGCNVYYTRAYASYEKGAVENVNRIIRRWFPKGTDFSKISRNDILAVETLINSMYRRSIKGMCANDYHKHMASSMA
jgi:IS30 family transposase